MGQQLYTTELPSQMWYSLNNTAVSCVTSCSNKAALMMYLFTGRDVL